MIKGRHFNQITLTILGLTMLKFQNSVMRKLSFTLVLQFFLFSPHIVVCPFYFITFLFSYFCFFLYADVIAAFSCCSSCNPLMVMAW